ncbi:MAG TPA: class I SAM-dependent methyltransferase [Myxococcales bacterium]
MSDRSFQFFLQFHQGVPRQGPGLAEATVDAFRRIQALLPPEPRILDLGCGSGGQTVTLAGLTAGTILAVDINEPFIEEMRRHLAQHGLEGRVTAQVGDMNALGLPPRSFDLVWCEGALFVTGFERGLRIIHELLRGPGLAVVSEAAWLRPTEEIPRDVFEFWMESYPAIVGVEENLALARKAGFEVLDHFTLAAEGWSAYVDPVERRMNEVLAKNPGDADAEKAAERERREIAMFRKNRGWFGYEFYLLKKK